MAVTAGHSSPWENVPKQILQILLTQSVHESLSLNV